MNRGFPQRDCFEYALGSSIEVGAHETLEDRSQQIGRKCDGVHSDGSVKSLARARSGSASRQSYRAHRDRLPSGRDRRNSHGITLTRRIRLDSVDIRTGPQ